MKYELELSVDEWDRLNERQKELEQSARELGIERFRLRVQKAAASHKADQAGAARSLLKASLNNLTDAITESLCTKREGSAGRRHIASRFIKVPETRKRKRHRAKGTAAKLISSLEPKAAAYITARTVLGCVYSRFSLSHTALNITNMLVDEIRYRRFRQASPALFEYRMKSFTTSNYAHMSRSMRASLHRAGVDCSDLEFNIRTWLLVGLKLIDLLIESTGLVQVSNSKTKKGRKWKQNQELVATDETLKWLKDRNEALEVLQPIKFPMVLPPLPWNRNQMGGYRYAMMETFGLVTAGGQYRSKKSQSIQKQHLPDVYAAVNTLQSTAWKVNPHVLALVERIMEQGGGAAGIPVLDDEPLPAKPPTIDMDEVVRKDWRRKAAKIKNENHKRRKQVLSAHRVVVAAQRMAEEPRMYFPYLLDFRGRIYAAAEHLSPQGDDLARALLLFAGVKPVDEHGLKYERTARPMDEIAARFLGIHGANCLGDTPESRKVSRMTLDERFDWVCQNTPRILAVADDPLADLWWEKADKPFQFYAFCVEWAGLVRANQRGEEYVCLLPVSMDGSCNGLQHFAALFRDDVGGKAVNLVPNTEPQDIYQRIADNVLKQLQEDGSDLSALWNGLHAKTGIVSRNLTKRPTMTFGYGSKKYGFAEQLADYLRDHEDWPQIQEHFKNAEEKSVFLRACLAMSGMIWAALQVEVVKAFEAMAWLQDAARGIAAGNRTVEWLVPRTGFPVKQNASSEYFHWKERRIKTVLLGKIIKPSYREYAEQQVNTKKQMNAVAPNVIHSLDAAVLMLTVNAAATAGVGQFLMVHDSYGALATDCAVLARELRQVFAQFYREDVVQNLYEQFSAQWEKPEECPLPPEKGSLDVSWVLASDYFFS